MKKNLMHIGALIIVVLSFNSCQKDDANLKDKSIIALSSIFNVYSHGSQGWTKADTVGVFSISNPLNQNNIAYISTGTATFEEKELKGNTYIIYNSAVTGEVELKPVAKEKAIVFNEGGNTIYAYIPYNKESSDYRKVPVPDITKQMHNTKEFRPYNEYGLYYATAKVSKYSDETTSLGAFKPYFSQITLPGVSCPDELIGKKCTKIIVRSERPIAYEKGATIDLSTLTITGNPVREIEYVLPEPFEVKSGYKGASISTTSYIMVAVPFETGLDTEFEFIFTIDGKPYSMKAKASPRMSKENNLNMYGNEGIK